MCSGETRTAQENAASADHLGTNPCAVEAIAVDPGLIVACLVAPPTFVAGCHDGGRGGSSMSIHSRTATLGQPAPDFALTDQHGTVLRLSDAIASGPVVLVFLRGFV